jgi:hypothetical protein
MYDVIDYNGDGIIDSDDSAPYGYTVSPQNTYNATLGFDYKGWSFFMQWYGVTNVTRYVAFNSLNKNTSTRCSTRVPSGPSTPPMPMHPCRAGTLRRAITRAYASTTTAALSD